ncbi:10108_t:CDS:2, partial [Racocetra persica]
MLTPTLEVKKKKIIEMIKTKLTQYNRKRKRVSKEGKEEKEEVNSVNSKLNEGNLEVTNYQKGHDFEILLRKIFNDAGFIVQKIQVTEGDGGLDMIVSYQTNQICIQSKDTENPLILKYVKDL